MKVRPKLLLDAFQWDGQPVEDWERVTEGTSVALIVPCYEGPIVARPGDFISISPKGVPMVWNAETFEEIYEVVEK